MKYDPEAKLAIEAKYDETADGTANRFTIGEKGDLISGAVYFKHGEVIPKMLILIFDLPTRLKDKENDA
jgi:hypothetical protein